MTYDQIETDALSSPGRSAQWVRPAADLAALSGPGKAATSSPASRSVTNSRNT